MTEDGLPSQIRIDDPVVAELADGLPTADGAIEFTAALRERLAGLRRRRGTGHRPLADVVRDGSANCIEFTLLVVSALRRAGFPAAGLMGMAGGTAPISVHAVAIFLDGGIWYVADLDHPAAFPLVANVAPLGVRPMTAWTETTAVLLYGELDRLADLYAPEGVTSCLT